MVYNVYIFALNDNGKPVERQGRKATGLMSSDDGRRVAEIMRPILPWLECAGSYFASRDGDFFMPNCCPLTSDSALAPAHDVNSLR